MRKHRMVIMFLGLAAAVVLAAGGGLAQDATPVAITGANTAELTNPMVPFSNVPVKFYEGEQTDPETGETVVIRVEERVLPETKVIAGVDAMVVEAKDIEDGELIELTHDYYAQSSDGTVYYLGEDVNDYEDGEVVGHNGAWLAGEGDNLAGVFMLPDPQVGDVFEQERAPGIAEDRSTVLETGLSLSTPAGDFTGCMKTEDVNPLDGETEFKFYCPDVGLVREEGENSFIELISYEGASQSTPAA